MIRRTFPRKFSQAAEKHPTTTPPSFKSNAFGGCMSRKPAMICTVQAIYAWLNNDSVDKIKTERFLMLL